MILLRHPAGTGINLRKPSPSTPLLPAMRREYSLLGAEACTSSYVVISLSHDVIFVVIMSFVDIVEYMIM